VASSHSPPPPLAPSPHPPDADRRPCRRRARARARARPPAVPIFSYNQSWLVLLYCAFMVWVSALEAIGRPSKTFKVRAGSLAGRGGRRKAAAPLQAVCFPPCLPPPLQPVRPHTHTLPQGIFLNTLVIVAASASLIMAYALIVVMRVDPWWQPQYLIPILGM
jgi:hypothetical protein